MAYDVFVSYRRADGQELANKVTAQLQQMGFKVFLDTSKMVKGQPFPNTLPGIRHLVYQIILYRICFGLHSFF